MEKIPSNDKLLGYAWIICWFLAIWIYHIQLFITGIFCLFLSYAIFDKSEKNHQQLPAQLIMDKNSRTLTVQKIYDKNMKWEENEICSGIATLPSGTIKEGDVVTNCEGNVSLRYIPKNLLFGAYDFK